jgi:hypothetical protein
MDNKNSLVNAQAKTQAQPKAKKMPPQQPQDLQVPGGPEIWDGNNDGWTYVSYSRKKKSKK